LRDIVVATGAESVHSNARRGALAGRRWWARRGPWRRWWQRLGWSIAHTVGRRRDAAEEELMTCPNKGRRGYAHGGGDEQEGAQHHRRHGTPTLGVGGLGVDCLGEAVH
jgi:hypothetical protein